MTDVLEALTGTWPIPMAIVAFLVAAGVIGVMGSRLVKTVDRLADRTGLGEAVAGAVLLGGSTSLAGLVVSIAAALDGNASLAVSNSVGGIAAQTTFLVVADIFYRRANLEHAAASTVNLFYSVLMTVLLAMVLVGTAAPPITILGVHPVSPLLVVTYLYGITMGYRIRREPMWQPEQTDETRTDEPQPEPVGESVSRLWLSFGISAVSVAVAGWVVAQSGLSAIEQTDLSGTLIGILFTSVATSIPELVTVIAAVRSAALSMAVGGIIGGNVFDILFVAAADVFYRPGSIYAAVTERDLFALPWAMLLVGILAAGLIRREQKGIGFEGYAVLGLYLAGIGVVVSFG